MRIIMHTLTVHKIVQIATISVLKSNFGQIFHFRCFSRKSKLVLGFLKQINENGLVRNVMIWRKFKREPNFDLGLSSREKDVQSRHCRPKIRFFYHKKEKKEKNPDFCKTRTTQALVAHACRISFESVRPFGL